MRVSPSLIGLAFAAALTSAPAMADAPLKAEVIHWWTSGGEAAAVKVFADAYGKAGGQWVDSAIAGGGGEAARTAGINRIVGGNPPTMMQFNTGKQLDELVSNSYLTNLDDAAAAGHWKDILPKPIVDASMRDGHWYALPVNIHGANWLFYNTKVFADAGVPEPKTWSDVLAAGPKLKAKGVIPFAHGGQAWQDHLLFDAVLAGEGGSDLYLSVYGKDPQEAIASPGFKHVCRSVQAVGRPDGSRHARPQLERRDRDGDHRQSRIPGDGRLGQGRVPQRCSDAGQGIWLAILGADGGYVMGGDVFVFPKMKDVSGTAAQAKLEFADARPGYTDRFQHQEGLGSGAY